MFIRVAQAGSASGPITQWIVDIYADLSTDRPGSLMYTATVSGSGNSPNLTVPNWQFSEG